MRLPILVGGKIQAIFDMHEPPIHLDEAVAFCLIEKFGDRKFYLRYSRKGVIEVGKSSGLLGGPLDEHPSAIIERKEGECAASLVAKALGIGKDPGLQRILHYVKQRDLESGGGQPFEDMAATVKTMSQQSPQQSKEVIEWVKMALWARYQQETRFHTVIPQEFRRGGTIEFLKSGSKVIKMAIIFSDDEQINAYSRHLGAAVVIQKNSRGNVQIFTDLKLNIPLDDVANMLNLAEQAAGGQVRVTDWTTLSKEGFIPGGKWYYFRQARMFLNGSLTHPKVLPTRIPLEEIKRIIRIGVNPKLLPSYCVDSCIYRKCGWYLWGLQRCQNIRRE